MIHSLLLKLNETILNVFCTTSNFSDWEEIKESLFPGENSHDRPDVVTRIFEQKVQELIRDLMKRGVLGKVVAIMLMTEWQKRGKQFIQYCCKVYIS